jgi:hypothetical protein
VTNHECTYGVFNDNGQEVTLTFLSEPGVGGPERGLRSEWLDRRKRYITPYVYCPYCGEKLNWNKFKRWVKQIDYSEAGPWGVGSGDQQQAKR